ncbi:MAG: sugar phosphate isomerase/epimerase [Verrucomicrobiales bacterium]|nr:sugar phosphate isomerase/epimerase [Verrucomicrobiales bacterium]
MDTFSRRQILGAAVASPAAFLLPSNLPAAEERFQIGIQEYTFNRWLKSGKLDHLDYPALVKKELGITHIEYWNRPFNGKHTDKAYVGELAKRTTGEGMKNVLILVDAGSQLDSADAAERKRAVEEHKGWIDCAAQLKCDAIRVNCRSGGDREENLRNAADGMGALCDYAKPSGVKVVIEPHGGNSKNPAWLLEAMKRLDRDNAGLLPDFNNFGEYDRYDAVEKTLPHAVAVCAKAFDFDKDGNETKTDFFRMLNIVKDSNYSGVISIEFEGHGIDPIEGSRKTKALIEKALTLAG